MELSSSSNYEMCEEKWTKQRGHVLKMSPLIKEKLHPPLELQEIF